MCHNTLQVDNTQTVPQTRDDNQYYFDDKNMGTLHSYLPFSLSSVVIV